MMHDHGRPESPSVGAADSRRSGTVGADDAELLAEEQKHPAEHTKTDHGEEHGGAPAETFVVGARTVSWALAGLLAGGALGLLLGVSLGRGELNVAGLAPLVAGGPGVPGFIFASFFGSLFGLLGALLGTAAEARAASREEQPSGEHERMGHGKPPFIQRLPIYGAVTLALFMAITLAVIAARATGSGTPSDQSNRVTWNQKNTTRVGGASDAETARHVLQIAYPATRPENRPGIVVTLADDWRAALAATSLVARPINAALILRGTAGTDAGTEQELERLRPTSGMQVAEASRGETIAGTDPAAIAAEVDERRARATGHPTPQVLIVAADADYRWALPAGAYAARTGTAILFVTKDGVPSATAAALGKRNGQARVYVLGPSEVVPAGVFEQLRPFGSVMRIEGSDPFTNAVRFAEFHDPASGFGWGPGEHGARRHSSVNTILVSSERWQDGVLAAHLARAGKSGALLLTERDRLPAVVDSYLWRQRPVFAETPAEGPFNHVWVVGSFERIAYGTQAWADYSQEITQYMTLGDSAVSGYEALAIGWLMLSIASAIWIVFHSLKRLPEVMPMMKAAWAIFGLILGPLAVWLYVKSYHRRAKMEMAGMVMWHRPLWAQTVSATVMMFAFDMMLMMLAVFAIAYVGFPIIRTEGPLSWLGSSMFLMMVLMYVVALVVMMLVFHTPMTMHERNIPSYRRAFLVGLPIMMATMTVESLGMMPTMWWQQMVYLPAMQMPTEDDITMWATLLVSAFVGFLVVLPFNYWMVRRGAKMGTM